MKKSIVSRFFAGVFFCAVLVLSGADAPEKTPSSVWRTDYAAAMDAAKKENKPVMLLFTGSDWCPACMALEKNVLSRPEFLEMAGNKFIPVLVDFPRTEPPSAEKRAQNERLLKEYLGNDAAFPTVVILSSSGKVLGTIAGYLPAERFLPRIESFLQEPPPLVRAVREHDRAGMEKLLKSGAKTDEVTPLGVTALMEAARMGSEEFIQVLLHYGASVSAKDKNGMTALGYSVREKYPEAAKALIRGGADPSGSGEGAPEDPLFLAIFSGRTEIVAMLLDAGAKSDVKFEKRLSPLAVAILTGKPEIAALLIERGADVMEKDSGGNTLLHCAAAVNDVPTAGLLIRKGLSPVDKNKQGKTPLDMASGEEVKSVLSAEKKP